MTKPGDSLTKKTIQELSKEFPNKTYRELEKYRDADRQEEAQRIITQQENEELKEDQEEDPDEVRYRINWKTQYEKEHKLKQEAEGELSIMKGIETNRVKEEQARSSYLQDELDRVKRENNDLHNKVAALLDAIDPEKNLKKARESGL